MMQHMEAEPMDTCEPAKSVNLFLTCFQLVEEIMTSSLLLQMTAVSPVHNSLENGMVLKFGRLFHVKTKRLFEVKAGGSGPVLWFHLDPECLGIQSQLEPL